MLLLLLLLKARNLHITISFCANKQGFIVDYFALLAFGIYFSDAFLTFNFLFFQISIRGQFSPKVLHSSICVLRSQQKDEKLPGFVEAHCDYNSFDRLANYRPANTWQCDQSRN